jgi:hypothetical protein
MTRCRAASVMLSVLLLACTALVALPVPASAFELCPRDSVQVGTTCLDNSSGSNGLDMGFRPAR